MAQLVILYPWSGSRERSVSEWWCCTYVLLSIQSKTLALKAVPPIFRVCLSTSGKHLWNSSKKHTYRYVSQVILKPINLTAKVKDLTVEVFCNSNHQGSRLYSLPLSLDDGNHVLLSEQQVYQWVGKSQGIRSLLSTVEELQSSFTVTSFSMLESVGTLC